MMRRWIAIGAAVMMTAAPVFVGRAYAATPSPEGFTLFGANDTLNGSSYDGFRIPAIVATTPGTLVAFAEGRRNSESDWGDIDLVMKFSTDNGANWSALQPVATGGTDTWGNPTPVYNPNSDPATGGTIWLFAQRTDGTITSVSQTTWENREVYALSKQVGANGAPSGAWTFKNLNSTLKPLNFKWDAIGPGNGIRLTQNGPDKGALVIPAWGRNIYSKDGGANWQQSTLPSREGVEGTVTERTDGSLYRNDRPGASGLDYRTFLSGTLNGGYTNYQWHNGANDTLTEPTNSDGCQGSTLRYNFDGKHRLMFLHPSSTTDRRDMKISISYDDGGTWDKMSRLIPRPTGWGSSTDLKEGGYSSMTKTSDFNVAALIEGSKSDPSNPAGTGSKEPFIVFHKFNLPWILNGRTEP